MLEKKLFTNYPNQQKQYFPNEFIPLDEMHHFKDFNNPKCVELKQPLCLGICSYSNCYNYFQDRVVGRRYSLPDPTMFVVSLSPDNLPYIEYIHDPQQTISQLFANVGGAVFSVAGVKYFALQVHCTRICNVEKVCEQ